ncbi:MAG: diguanylate cyclase [Mariprofundaceae bacterium]
MKRLRDDPSRVVILGAGSDGLAMLELLSKERLVDVVAVVDYNPDAPGMACAAKLGVPTHTDIEKALVSNAPCVAFNLTGNEMVEAIASDILGTGAVIGGLEAKLMWRMVTNLRDAKDRLKFQASHDELTNLYNRRHMLKEMERELNQVMRYDVPFSLVLIDLDYFKNVNDTHGHAAGDVVLKYVAQLLKKGARTTDVIGRWGGEEFLVLLPHSTAGNASQAVEKWLKDVCHQPVSIPSGETVSVAFSAGIAAFKKDDVSASLNEVIDRLLARADEHLYEAKHAGRACVIGDE